MKSGPPSSPERKSPSLPVKTQKLDRFLVMTLLLAAFYFTNLTSFQLVLWSLVAGAFVFGPQTLRHWLLWASLCAVMAAATMQTYFLQGNDYFLILYLSLTALVALQFDRPLNVIRLNARLLIGIVFALATLWKLTSESFLSGTFFVHTLLFDNRLAPIARTLGQLPAISYHANRDAWDNLDLINGFHVLTTPEIQVLAIVLTGLALLVEGMIAVSFLLPFEACRRLRDPLLLAFFVGSYTLLPVPSFGMALATLGYAQATNPRIERLYALSYALMPLTALRAILTFPHN